MNQPSRILSKLKSLSLFWASYLFIYFAFEDLRSKFRKMKAVAPNQIKEERYLNNLNKMLKHTFDPALRKVRIITSFY